MHRGQCAYLWSLQSACVCPSLPHCCCDSHCRVSVVNICFTWSGSFEDLESHLRPEFALRECGGDGDCLYHCAAFHIFGSEAESDLSNSSLSTSHKRVRLLRHLVADVLQDDERLTEIFDQIQKEMLQRMDGLIYAPFDLQTCKDDVLKDVGLQEWSDYCKNVRCQYIAVDIVLRSFLKWIRLKLNADAHMLFGGTCFFLLSRRMPVW